MNPMSDLSAKPAFEGLTLETAISVTKSILLGIGFISTLILFKVAIIPKFTTFIITTLPTLFFSFRLWLSPFHVFVLFNFLLFAALASSAFLRQKDTSETTTHLSSSTSYKLTHQDTHTQIWNGISDAHQQEEIKPMQWDFPTLFTNEQKITDPSSEKFSCAYSVTQRLVEEYQKDGGEDDSMDAMWKAIMEKEEKQKPQLKKSQTWDSPPPVRLARAAGGDEEPVGWDRNYEVRKSEKLQQTMSFRRKISMTSEELKSRAEAFIEMVNRSIRLQRQESEQRFLQATKRSF